MLNEINVADRLTPARAGQGASWLVPAAVFRDIPPDHPDAALLAALAAHAWHEEFSEDNYTSHGYPTPNPVIDEGNRISELIISLPATTLEGHLARAAQINGTAEEMAEEAADHLHGDYYNRLTAALVRDLKLADDRAVLTDVSDNQVIASCQIFEAMERDFLQRFYEGDTINRTDRPEQDAALPGACAPASSMAALKAKARAAVTFAPDLLDHDEDSNPHERLVASMLRDLLGEAWIGDLHRLLRRKERTA